MCVKTPYTITEFTCGKCIFASSDMYFVNRKNMFLLVYGVSYFNFFTCSYPLIIENVCAKQEYVAINTCYLIFPHF